MSPAQASYAGGPTDIFVAKFDAAGSSLLFSTFLGSAADDQAIDVAVDPTGAAYVVGWSNSAAFPLQSPVQGSFGGNGDVVVAKYPLTNLGGGGGGGGGGTPPAAPADLVAEYDGGSVVALSWTDNASNETGFEIERKAGNYASATLGTTGADETSYDDDRLFPSTTFTYRVRAVNAGGTSDWSNEASITTNAAVPPPMPPAAPSGLVATPSRDLDGNALVSLSWIDNSSDETLFAIERLDGGGRFGSAGNVAAGVTGFLDYGPHPGWPVSYRVRALSLQGPSAYTNPADAKIPATLDVSAAAGALTDSGKLRGDKLKVSATYAPLPESPAEPDLLVNGLALQLGPAAAPVSVSIPPGDGAWKVKTKKGAPVKATWKSAKGVSPKVTVVVDLVKHLVTATASGFDFAAAPTTSVRVLLACGPDGGAETSTWTEKKPGVLLLK